MKKSVHLKTSKLFCSVVALFAVIVLNAQSAPEIVFTNPVLKSGIANKQGAIYRFSNVTTDVDAELKLKKFSRPDIQMDYVDRPDLGWDKALQPNFGLPGLVAPNQNWYIDFELTFYKAGTNIIRTMDTVDLTALDVDGDGVSISEYVTYDRPSSIAYSTVSYLTNSSTSVLGQLFQCDECGVSSILVTCNHCGGTGLTNSGSGTNNPCSYCDGSGIVYQGCGHPYEGVTGNTVWGPVTNFTNIDTSATQVMATYQYLKTNLIKFRYGAKSGATSVNGSGIRLNSTWFRNFSLAPLSTLPIKLLDFSAKYTKPNVSLEWSTAQEHNFSHFIIEHSTDGTNFSQTAIVFGAGESDSKIDYSYTDKDMNGRGGIIYYRLKQVDIDGTFSYSPVRMIKLDEEKKTMTITSFPNPVVNELHVTIPAAWQGKEIKYALVNINGQLVKQLTHSNASQTETITVNELQKGVYFVKVDCNNESGIQRIIKN